MPEAFAVAIEIPLTSTVVTVGVMFTEVMFSDMSTDVTSSVISTVVDIYLVTSLRIVAVP